MTSEFATHSLANGTRLQAGIPTRPVAATLPKANGLMMRGVVTATYVVDTTGHPAEFLDNANDCPPVSVYCDVLCYTQRSGQRWVFIPKAMVLQDRGAMHSGRIWKPRAATFDITGDPMDPAKGTHVENFDGDHVLIGFIDDSFSLPVVLGGVPHPRKDLGNDSKDIGHRMNLKVADGDPDFWKHKGAFYGITKAGDFLVDTTKSFAKDLETTGKEPDAPKDGSTGNYNVKLQEGSKLHIQIADGETLKVELKGGNTKLTLGDGAKHVAIVEALKTLYNSLKDKLDTFDNHTHLAGALTAPSGGGPVTGTSGAPVSPIGTPAWSTSIESTKVSIPDG